MVDAVRDVYSGLQTFEVLYLTVGSDEDLWEDAARWVWKDLGLDIIGVSAYYPLTEIEPQGRLSYAQLKAGFESVFNDYLEPLQADNPQLPMVFTEYGYVDSIRSPFFANFDEGTVKTFMDEDGSGFDDGEETQADVHRAMFTANRERNGMVKGYFFWGHGWADDQLTEDFWGAWREFMVRGRLAEDVVREEHARLAAIQTFTINAGLNEAWYNPDTAGQGFFISVYPDIPLMFLAWFTYDVERPPLAGDHDQHVAVRQRLMLAHGYGIEPGLTIV